MVVWETNGIIHELNDLYLSFNHFNLETYKLVWANVALISDGRKIFVDKN